MEEEGTSSSLGLGWAGGCPMPSGTIMPPYAEIGAGRGRGDSVCGHPSGTGTGRRETTGLR